MRVAQRVDFFDRILETNYEENCDKKHDESMDVFSVARRSDDCAKPAGNRAQWRYDWFCR